MPTSTPSRAAEARGRLLVLAVPQQRRQVVVLVAGEVDRATAPQLREMVVDSLVHRPRSVVVDASDLTFCDLGALDALADAVGRGRLGRLAVERFDGEPIVGSDVEDVLVELGFRQGPRKLTLSA